jgi:hypothetical protein
VACILVLAVVAAALPVMMGCSAAGAGGTIPLAGSGMLIPGYVQTTPTNPALALPVYWHDGVLTLLSTGTQSNGYALSVVVKGNDVYIIGYTENGTTASTQTPAYWLNGALHTLPLPGAGSGTALNGALDPSGSLYITGQFFSSTSGLSQPGYWKDGTWVPLSMMLGTFASPNGIAESMFIDQATGDIYCCGWLADAAGLDEPVYWLNGTPHPVSLASLPGATHGAHVQMVELPPFMPSLTVLLQIKDGSGQTSPAYMVGSTITPVSTSPDVHGAVWFVFPSPAGDHYGTGMIGTFSGYTTLEPAYWLNWAPHVLPTPAGQPYGNAAEILFSGGHRYTVGTANDSNGISSAIYWVDETLNVLSSGGYAGASLGGTFVFD